MIPKPAGNLMDTAGNLMDNLARGQEIEQAKLELAMKQVVELSRIATALETIASKIIPSIDE